MGDEEKKNVLTFNLSSPHANSPSDTGFLLKKKQKDYECLFMFYFHRINKDELYWINFVVVPKIWCHCLPLVTVMKFMMIVDVIKSKLLHLI